MVGMFFSDGVLVAGVAVGRRGPLAFSVKCTVNSYIYVFLLVLYALYTYLLLLLVFVDLCFVWLLIYAYTYI